MNSSGNGETDTHTTKVGLKRKAVHGSRVWGAAGEYQPKAVEAGKVLCYAGC